MPTRHPPVLIWLHWLTALAVASAVALALLRSGVDGHALRGQLLDWHRQAGLAVAGLTLLRLTLRLRYRPASAAEDPPALARVARAGHAMIYLLLASLPVLGLLLAQARGQAVSLLGLVPLPLLVGRNRGLAEQLVEWHENAAWLLIGLVGLHVTAALWHHYIRRDTTLRRMLPGSARPLSPL